MDNEAFQKQLLEAFKLEAEDHLKELNDGIRLIEKGEEGEVYHTLFRAAHSLKGASRAVDLISVESSCQALESKLSSLKNGELTVDKPFIRELYDLVERIEQLIFGEQKQPFENQEQQAAKPSSSNDGKSIRLNTDKVSKLLQHVEEMLVIKLSSKHQHKSLLKLQSKMNRWEQEIQVIDPDKQLLQLVRSLSGASDEHRETLSDLSNQLSRLFETQKEFMKEVRDDLNEQARASEQDHRLIGGMVDSVLDDTKEILMQPFGSIVQGFHKSVREIAQSLGKEVCLTIIGDNVEIDRRILEKLKDPLLHIVRNSLDHGLEKSEERGDKPTVGQLFIEAVQLSSSSVRISVSDDGRGVDIEKVKQIAVNEGIYTKEQVDALSKQEVLSLIYQAGVTTRTTVSELSGLGMGLNVVTDNVEKLGGVVEISTEERVGTTTTITIPLTLSTFRGIHVRVADQDFMIPTHHVHRVMRVPVEQFKKVENRLTVPFEKSVLSYLSLGDLLGIPEEESEKSHVITLVLCAADTMVAFGVDQILNEQEIFVKSLGKQLKNVKNISGAAVMEWGKVVPILDPIDMIKSLTKGGSHRKVSIQKTKDVIQEKKSILIAEDSVTSRMLLKNILESAGYQVKSAVDGIEAYSILSTEEIHLLLSDVEMPRMTGFELTEKLRRSEKFQDLPVVLCTSLGSKEDREKGIEVGANAYIDKSSFEQSNLLAIIEQML